MSIVVSSTSVVAVDGVNMKFEIGDKIMVSRKGVDWIHEMDQYIGKEGVVKSRYEECLFWVSSMEMKYIGYCLTINGKDIRHYFCEESLELVGESIPANNQCPRCNGEMVEKKSEHYGVINKCRNCGYC